MQKFIIPAVSILVLSFSANAEQLRSIKTMNDWHVAMQSNMPKVIEFSTPLVNNSVGSLFESQMREYGNRIVFIRVNAEEYNSLARQYGVQSYPTYIFLDKSNNIVDRIRGARPQEMAKILARIARGEKAPKHGGKHHTRSGGCSQCGR